MFETNMWMRHETGPRLQNESVRVFTVLAGVNCERLKAYVLVYLTSIMFLVFSSRMSVCHTGHLVSMSSLAFCFIVFRSNSSIPFIFNAEKASMMVFYVHKNGTRIRLYLNVVTPLFRTYKA